MLYIQFEVINLLIHVNICKQREIFQLIWKIT